MRRLAILALVTAAPAAAQPTTRYPKPPVDEDRAREQRSALWDAATHPAKAPYTAAIDEARRKYAEGDFQGTIHVAEHAIALLPDAPDAYLLRGEARLKLHSDWPGCADDLGTALAHARADKPLGKDVRRDLGVCQARAGRLADAETTLSDAAALASHDDRERWEVWMRLGEVRVAMGKLDEAIAAFDTSITEGSTASVTLWQRAGAYDRARQPSKAEEDVRAAMNNDRSKSQIDSGVLPLLGAGERELLFGIACQYEERPELESALLYFRRFLAVAPASPWRRRAEEHLRELSAMPLPQSVARTSGNAPLDQDVATKIVREAMPRMRACLAKLPDALIEVRITRAGPRAPAPGTPGIVRVGFRAPPAGVQTTPLLPIEEKPGEVDAATRCLETIADKLPLPVIKDKEMYYQIAFSVIAP